MANLYQDAQQSALAGASQLNDIFGQIAGINTERAEAKQAAAADQQLVTSTEALAIAKQQKQALQFATELGTNPEDANQVLSGLLADKKSLFETARANLRAIRDTKNTSLFFDPLKWLTGNLNLERDTNNYNAAAEEYNLVGKRVDDIVSQTDDLVKMTKGIQVSMTDASAQAAARLASQRLLDESAQANIAALQSNAEGIQRVQQLKQTALSNSVQQQQLGMEAQRLALAKQNAALEQQKLSLMISDKQENKEEQTRTIQAVNLYRKTNGMPEVSWTDLKLLYKDPQQKALIDQQITGGLTIAQSGGRYLADKPSTALEIASSNGAKLAAGPESLVSTATSIAAQVRNDVNAGKFKPKTRDDYANEVNQRMTQRAQSEIQEIKTGNDIYKPPSMETLLSDKGIASTASARLVLAPLATSGMKDFNASLVVPQILEAAKKGEIPLNQAISDITYIAGKAMAYNNAFYSYESTMGLPNLKGYPVRLETTGRIRSAANTVASGLNDIFAPVPYLSQSNVVTGAAGSLGTVISSVAGGRITEITDLTSPAKVQDYATRYMAGSISANLKEQAAVASKTKGK